MRHNEIDVAIFIRLSLKRGIGEWKRGIIGESAGNLF